MKKTFTIYPFIKVVSCAVCPYKNQDECTYTDGPKFEDGPLSYIPDSCPIAKDEKQ